MPRIVGIDLGTTHSLVAAMGASGPEILPDPRSGARLLPSAVSVLPEGSFLVGETARERAALHPESSILSVKRFMGIGFEHLDEHDRREHRFRPEKGALTILLRRGDGLPDQEITPPQVSALILRELRRRAETTLGEEVQRAVITVPAYFDDSQRQATRDAGRLAGLDVLRLVNEPTAAALAYGLEHQQDALVAVYDLGGGTFDVSILQLREGLSEVLATGGDTHLGGDDFDRRIADYFRESLNLGTEELADLRTSAMLRAAAEKAKRILSDEEVAHVELPLPGGARVGTIRRQIFEARTADLVERTLDHCRRTLADAGRTTSDVDQVILVGGATRIPMVRRRVTELFGREPLCSIDPDQVVALGAAVQAGVLSGGSHDMLLLDVVPLSLGIETMGGVFTRLIDRNTTIPAAVREQFTTAVDHQTHVEIHVLQGERELAKDCRSLSRFRIPIPPEAAGLPRVEVTFLIDANGILSVSARDVRTNTERSIEVKPSYGLSDEMVEQMLEESFDLAEEDFAQRQLIEARIEAETLLHKTESALRRHPQLLEPGERSAIEAAASDLRRACQGSDHNQIRDLLECLNEVSVAFAQRIMDSAIRLALEQRHVEELVE